MKNVKFKSAGKWADPDPKIPHLEVEAGKTYPVSNELADIVEDAGRGTIVKAPKQGPTKMEIAQGVVDKAKAVVETAQGAVDKATAELGAAGSAADKTKAQKKLDKADKEMAEAVGVEAKAIEDLAEVPDE